MPGMLFSEDPSNRIKGDATVFTEHDFDCIEITCMWDIHQRMSKTYTYKQLQEDFDAVSDFIRSANEFYDKNVASQE